MKLYCEFVGGERNGVRLPVEEAEKLTAKRSEDLSEIRARGGLVHRQELDNRPVFDGYCGPMWDGTRRLGGEECGVLRYETWEVYDLLSR